MQIKFKEIKMKTVLITGGSRGIGKAMVELFSSKGYKVAFTYKKSENEAKTLIDERTSDIATNIEIAFFILFLLIYFSSAK